jgi:hypothetical protein
MSFSPVLSASLDQSDVVLNLALESQINLTPRPPGYGPCSESVYAIPVRIPQIGWATFRRAATQGGNPQPPPQASDRLEHFVGEQSATQIPARFVVLGFEQVDEFGDAEPLLDRSHPLAGAPDVLPCLRIGIAP